MPLRRSPLWSDPRTKPPHGVTELDQGHPLAIGLRAGYPLTEGGGDVMDMTGRGPRGTRANMVSPDGWASTGRGLALSLDGTDDHVDFSRPIFTDAPPLSIVANILPFRYGDFNTGNGIFYQGSGAAQVGTNFLVFTGANTTNGLAFIWEGGTLGYSTASCVALNAWQQVAVTHSAAPTTLFYVNGVYVADASAGGAGAPAAANAHLGYWYDAAAAVRHFQGHIEYVYTYSRELSQEHIQWLAAEPYAMLQPIVRRRYFPAAATPVLFIPSARARLWAPILAQ